jgi:hypothetical protein
VIDKERLLAWLRYRSSGSLVTGSVYQGLIARIERGDFDTREDED